MRKNNKSKLDLGALLKKNYFYLFVVVYLFYASNIPVALRFDQIYDDALFIGQGHTILQGDWLGDYNNLTRVKGPAFSLFLSLLGSLSISFQLGSAILHAAATLILRHSFKGLGVNAVAGNITSIFLLFNPMLVPQQVIRDYFNSDIFILIIALGILVATETTISKRTAVLAGSLGMAGGIFWMTREEAIWVSPIFFLSILTLLFGHGKINAKKALRAGGASLVLVAGFILPQSVVSQLNFSTYGDATIVERNSYPFSDSMASLYSVLPENHLDYVPMPQISRQKVSELSPKFSELVGYLDGEGQKWTTGLCWKYEWTCGEFAGGWFEFAIRDAVQSRGYYSTPKDAEKFYTQLNEELDKICKTHIKCTPSFTSAFPPLSDTQIGKLPDSMWEGFQKSILALPMDLYPGFSTLQNENASAWMKFLGNPLYVGERKASILSTIDPEKEIRLMCKSREIEFSYEPSQDLADAMGNQKFANSRIKLELPEDPQCSMQFSGASFSIDFNNLQRTGVKQLNLSTGEVVYIEYLPPENEVKQNSFSSVRSALYSLFSLVFAPLLIFGAAVQIVNFFKYKKLARVNALVIALWIFLLLRLGILALIDISSFASMYQNYLQPAIALTTILAGLQLNPLFVGFWGKKRRKP